jgi:hypothetical protein
LNQKLQWQLNNSTRKLGFVSLNQNQLKLMIFTDAAFANTSIFTVRSITWYVWSTTSISIWFTDHRSNVNEWLEVC